MGDTGQSYSWQPVTQAERYASLDVLRGMALFGVLLVNLLSDFRVSLAEHILSFHTHAGWVNRAVDVLVAAVLESKAFALFSLTFGVGVAVQAERAAARAVNVGHFLARRFLVLLAFGLVHMSLIWNGDILALYAVCGLLLLPVCGLSAGAAAALGCAAVALNFAIPWEPFLPTEETLQNLAAEATRNYAEGGLADIVAFRWREAWLLIMPLLAASLLKTWGLMLLGVAAWKARIFREPDRRRRLLWMIAIVGGVVGGTTTVLSVWSASSGQSAGLPPILLDACSHVPLALAYAAIVLLCLPYPATTRWAASFAAAGRLALTNYLAQSVILGLIFYSYGLGLFGRLGPASASLIGLTVYVGQLAFSRAWLWRYRFGPVEWLWRSLTYGRWQPLRRRHDI